ncbi:MAG TPA: hypothetical protein VFN30_01230 [Chitinophagaceae bacterium]|nr:hypothetical protein [Chitinophagaceae bacterium]
MNKILLAFITCIAIISCKTKESLTDINTAKLIFKFKFDSTQTRLNNIGQPSFIPPGNAALSPVMNKMSAHYIELAPNALTQLGTGAVLYRSAEINTGGSNAIDFSQSRFAGNNEVFYEIPIKDITPGEYEWLRISLAYQNADVKYRIDTTINGFNINQDNTGTLASFIGFNTYLNTFTIKNQSLTINGNRKQGFWGFETNITASGISVPITNSGQAPEGSTTVVNPLFTTSPIPPGSCVITAALMPGKLKITGAETKDIVIEASFSTNKSFEWKDIIANGKWEPLKGETLVDMGVRGMIPVIK